MTFVSKGEMNTELAKRLKRILARSAKKKYAEFNEQKKKRPKQDNGGATAEHVDANAVPKGVLGKVKGYAQNGSDYIRSKDGRGVYKNWGHKHLEQIKDLTRKAAQFPGGPPENFNPSAKSPTGGNAGQQWPYPWDAHHILPGSAFYYVMKVGGKERHAFTFEQLQLILQSDYNINHGHNIINLPKESWAVPVHALIQHPGDHPRYTQKVMKGLLMISDDLQEIVDQQEDHAGLESAVFKALKNLEEENWKFLVDLSRRLVEALTEGMVFEDDHVRFAPESGTSTYEWGSLY